MDSISANATRRLSCTSTISSCCQDNDCPHLENSDHNNVTWALWTYRCNQLYDAANIHLSYVLLEIWENLLAIIRGQYDNIHCSLEPVNKRRKNLLPLWKKLPLFTMSTQEPQWHYRLPCTLSWISTNFNTFYKVRYLVLRLFYIIVHKNLQPPAQQGSSCSLQHLQSSIFGPRIFYIIVHKKL